MVGLVFKDLLLLTGKQQSCLIFNMLLCLLAIRQKQWKEWKIFILYVMVLWSGFHGEKLILDVRITWGQLYRLEGLTFQQFISTFPHCNYIHLQPPWITWWFVKIPNYHLHQLYALTWMVFCFFLCYNLYGRVHMLLIASTPLIQLISSQPTNDIYSFGLILIAYKISLKFRFGSSQIFFLACILKYSSCVVFPWLYPRFGLIPSLFLLGEGIFYIKWIKQSYWGTLQVRYLLHQFSFSLIPYYTAPKQSIYTPTTFFQKKCMKVVLAILWRGRNIIKPSLLAYPFYLFPIYCFPINFKVVPLMSGIVIGYGNIKYLLLILPFCFAHHQK